jgi:hypothetical protein
MKEMRNAYNTSVGKSEGKRPPFRLRNNIRIVLRKQGGKVWTGFIWLRIGTSGELL